MTVSRLGRKGIRAPEEEDEKDVRQEDRGLAAWGFHRRHLRATRDSLLVSNLSLPLKYSLVVVAVGTRRYGRI